jgi:hypothetical protein
MTWEQLAKEIELLTPEQRNTDVTVFVRGVDEFYPVTDRLLIAPPEEQILDPNHPYIQV